VVERKNHSIVGATKAMLHDRGLPVFSWVEACNTAIFMQNKSPHKVLGQVTPKEAFTCKKPDVSHFCIFVTKVCYHVSKDSKKKLEPNVEKGIFVDYNETSQAYRVYIPSLKMTIIRQDVRFEEDRALRESLEQGQVGVLEESQPGT